MSVRGSVLAGIDGDGKFPDLGLCQLAGSAEGTDDDGGVHALLNEGLRFLQQLTSQHHNAGGAISYLAIEWNSHEADQNEEAN